MENITQMPPIDRAANGNLVSQFFGKALAHFDQLYPPFEISAIPSFCEYTLVSMEGMVNLIKQAIPIGMIYNLSKKKKQIDLIIVLEKNCTKAYSEFERIIELLMLGFENGTCTIHNYGLLNSQLSKGHLFYTSVCVAENLIYRKNTEEIFCSPNEEIIAMRREESALLFNAGLQRAVSFYEGAHYYLEKNTLEMAMFMLHQACELAYRCLLNVLRGKDLKCHSPAILRKHVKRFAPEVIGAFSKSEEEELYYLQLLEDAYIQSRYELNYSIDQETVVYLNEKVGLLLERTKELFGNRIKG
jgi:HEPN domain-containing protein